MSDVIADFIGAMERAGMAPAEPIADKLASSPGEIVRFQCGDDRKGRQNGWALLHLDGTPAGVFGNYRMAFKATWRSGNTRSLSAIERLDLRRRHQAEHERRKTELDRQHREVATACEARWAQAQPADASHPYLKRKRVSGEGLRQIGDRLFVPLRDGAGTLWNLQTILGDGTKRFAKGGRQRGLICTIGAVGDTAAIGEGFSTMAAVRRATGHAVVIAFSAANLREAALAVRAAHPKATIILAADDDAHLVDHPQIKKNIGLEAAKEAARAVGGRVAMPPRGN